MESRVPDQPVDVLGDDARLHQVLANLLASARIHPPGTTVTVSVQTCGDRAVLRVVDDGRVSLRCCSRRCSGVSSAAIPRGRAGRQDGLAIAAAVVRPRRNHQCAQRGRAHRVPGGVFPRRRCRDAAAMTRHRIGLALLLIATATPTWIICQPGGLTCFSAAAQAGGADWTAWLFGSSDAANAITVDKPRRRCDSWAHRLGSSGVNPWSILLPQALAGTAAVAVPRRGALVAGPVGQSARRRGLRADPPRLP